jgi:hypothetical protein
MPHIPAAEPNRLRRGIVAAVALGAAFWLLVWIIANAPKTAPPAPRFTHNQ